MLSNIISSLEEEIERDFTSTEDFENWEWGKGKADMEIECNNTLYHIDYSLQGFKKIKVKIEVFDRMTTKEGKVRYFLANSDTPTAEILSYAFVYLLRDRYDELEKEEELLRKEEEETERDYEAMQDTYASLEKQFIPQY